MDDAPLHIRINGEARTLPAGCTLAALVAQSGQAACAVATAVNGDFVARDRRAARVLEDGDAVDVFQAIVGG